MLFVGFRPFCWTLHAKEQHRHLVEDICQPSQRSVRDAGAQAVDNQEDAEVLGLSDFRPYLKFLPFLSSVIFLLFHKRKEFEHQEPRNPRYLFSPLMPDLRSFYYLTVLLGLAIVHCPNF